MDEQAFITEVIKRGIVSFAQIQECLQASPREKIWDLLIRKGWATSAQVAEIFEGKPGARVLSFGPFQLLEKLGEGGMGVVYRAKKHDSDREVAIKILPERFTNTEGSKRFEREAKAAIAITHPHVVKGYEFGTVNNRLFFSMELIEGKVVGALLDERGPMDEPSVLRIGLQIAEALDAIHRRGLVHRDIKPDNMIVTAEGIVKLMDLGLIKSTQPGATIVTQSGHTLGSPHYIAPERVMGTGEDIRSDIYSLGASLYHMITGAAPFDATITVDILRKQISGVPLDDPCILRPEISRGLRDVVEKMMARDPEDRHPTPRDAVADLRELVEGRPPKSAPLPPGRSIIRRGEQRPKRLRLLWAGLGIAAASLISTAWVVVIPKSSDPSELALKKAQRDLHSYIRADAFNEAALLLQREPGLQAMEPELKKAALSAWKDLEESSRDLPWEEVQARFERFRRRSHLISEVDQAIEMALQELAVARRDELIKRDAEKRFEMLDDSIVDYESKGQINDALAILKRARARADDNPDLASKIDAKIRQLERLLPDSRQAGDLLLAEAQAALDLGALDKAAAKVEEARGHYVAAGATAQIEACIRLAELIEKRRAVPASRPEPTPQPPPPKTPRETAKAPVSVETAYKILKDLSATGKISEARSVARALVTDTRQRDGRVEAAAYILHRLDQDPAWCGAADRRALAEYLSAVDWIQFDEMTLADHAKALADLKSRPAECLRIIEFLHLNRVLQMSVAHSDLLVWAKERGLVSIDLPRGLCLATPGGLQISQSEKLDLAELRKVGLANDPYFALYRTYRELVHFCGLAVEEKKKRASDLSRLLLEAKPPAGFKNLFKSLSGKIKAPCRACNGAGTIDCRSCEDGQVSLVCGTCNGWGGLEQYPCGNCRGKDCARCRGRGFVFARPCRACEEKGRWKEECSKCSGAGKLDDPQCKEPWIEPLLSNLVSTSDCRTCRKTGLAFERVFIACADCGSLGQIVIERDR